MVVYRLRNAKAMGYSKWEASEIGTAAAVDLIPRSSNAGVVDVLPD